MNFNNAFPVSYPYYGQPMQQLQQAQQPQQQQMNYSNMTWVQGETGAKSYQVVPNTTVALWDSEDKRIFLKSSDAMGMPSMKKLRYVIEDEAPAHNNLVANADVPKTDFATKDDILSIQEQIDALKGKIEKENNNYERSKSSNNGKSITK